MKLSDLKEEHLIRIIELYEKYCGFGRTFRDVMYYQDPKTVLQELKSGESLGEYRVGSKWDGHSKIYLETDFKDNFKVRFNSNFDPRDRKGKKYKNAEKAGQEFVRVAMEYLNQS